MSEANRKSGYSAMKAAMEPSHTSAFGSVVALNGQISALQGQRDTAVKGSLEIYNKLVLLNILVGGIGSREKIHADTSGSPLLNGINMCALDILSNPTADPLQLGAALDDRVVDFTIPRSGDALNSRKLIPDFQEESPLPASVLRVGTLSTSVVFFNQENSSAAGIPAVVLSITDGGEGRYTISGRRAVYEVDMAADAFHAVQKRDLTAPPFLQLFTQKTESELVESGFLSPAEYQAALSLVSTR